MSLLSTLFGKRKDLRAPVRPLWLRVVEIAREKPWYAQCGVADTTPGRFDMVTLVFVLLLLRMEKAEALIEPSVRLTELFVEDMDGQLRQNGVGDLVVGKHIGKLMGVLGGRLGALRDALAQDAARDGGTPDQALAEALARNVTLIDNADAARLTDRARVLIDTLAATADADLLAGRIAR